MAEVINGILDLLKIIFWAAVGEFDFGDIFGGDFEFAVGGLDGDEFVEDSDVEGFVFGFDDELGASWGNWCGGCGEGGCGGEGEDEEGLVKHDVYSFLGATGVV